MKRHLRILLFSLVLITFPLSTAPATATEQPLSSFTTVSFSKAQRVCNASEKALLINLNGEINKLINQRVQLRKKATGIFSEQEKLLVDTQLLTLDIKISNFTSERDSLEKSCNSKKAAGKVKKCSKSDISQISNWAKDFELKQRELKLQWDKVIAAQNLSDAKSRFIQTSTNQKIYMEMQAAAEVKKEEFDALNAGCTNSGIKLVSRFVPGKAAADQAAAEKAAADKIASDKLASEKSSGVNLPKVGDCWNYTKSEVKDLSNNKSSIPCDQQHTMVTYKVAFWPKTTQDPYVLQSKGDENSVAAAASVFCDSAKRYEENLKSGTRLTTGAFFIPNKALWTSGARWINCLEARLAYSGNSSSDWDFVPWSGAPSVLSP
ncbi:MAG: hypothetical protein NTY85_05035 [Actinobacteria bacterium]|nr:hypothetical protein [Actinomycetota bacterium]